MKAAYKFHEMGQSLWQDGITRGMLDGGRLMRAIEEWSVTGLTFDPFLFTQAIRSSSVYDDAIGKRLKKEMVGEKLLFDLALEDLRHAADLFRPIHDRTDGLDGWVAIGVSPLIAHEAGSVLAAAKDLYRRAGRPNFMVTIPGSRVCLPAVEEAIEAGVPVNVGLLFSREHYLAAAEAFLRGTERRIAAGLSPGIASIASLSIGLWDAAVAGRAPDGLDNQLGIAVAGSTYKACRELLQSPRWERAFHAGARPHRLLWAGSGAPVSNGRAPSCAVGLAAPMTIHTMPEGALEKFFEPGEPCLPIPADGGDCEFVLARFQESSIQIEALADQFQNEEVDRSVKSWIELLSVLASKSAALAAPRSQPSL